MLGNKGGVEKICCGLEAAGNGISRCWEESWFETGDLWKISRMNPGEEEDR